ncbi:MAG: N-acetylmuramoyl-L-alanine amidase [Candidatus Omnitrophota bacterium]
MKNKYFLLLVPNVLATFVSSRDPEVSLRRLAAFGATCYLLLFFISGCATVPISEGVKAHYIAGARYYALDELCGLSRIDWFYDEIGEVATLKKENHVLKIMPQSNLALLDDRPITLDKPVIIRDSRLLVPASFKAEIVDRFFYERIEEYADVDKFLASKKVMIDPGHGGKDPGAIARSGLYEKDVVLDIAQRLKAELRRRGIQVVMTRNSDTFVPLEKRSTLLNDSKADLFLSIHVNANRSKRLSGVEVYYLTNNVNDSLLAKDAAQVSDVTFDGNSIEVESDTLKAILWDMLYTSNRQDAARLAKLICKNLSFFTGLKSGTVKQANFSVLRLSLTPAVLVEVAYLSNKNDESKLNSSAFKEQVAKGLSAAIVEFLKSQKREYY